MIDSVVIVFFKKNYTEIRVNGNDFFLFFKNYFWHQNIKIIQNIMIFFYFLKIIFDIKTSQRSKTYKTYWIFLKKIKIF